MENYSEDQGIVVPSFQEEVKISDYVLMEGYFDYDDQTVKENMEIYVLNEVLIQSQLNNHRRI